MLLTINTSITEKKKKRKMASHLPKRASSYRREAGIHTKIAI